MSGKTPEGQVALKGRSGGEGNEVLDEVGSKVKLRVEILMRGVLQGLEDEVSKHVASVKNGLVTYVDPKKLAFDLCCLPPDPSMRRLSRSS